MQHRLRTVQLHCTILHNCRSLEVWTSWWSFGRFLPLSHERCCDHLQSDTKRENPPPPSSLPPPSLPPRPPEEENRLGIGSPPPLTPCVCVGVCIGREPKAGGEKEEPLQFYVLHANAGRGKGREIVEAAGWGGRTMIAMDRAIGRRKCGRRRRCVYIPERSQVSGSSFSLPSSSPFSLPPSTFCNNPPSSSGPPARRDRGRLYASPQNSIEVFGGGAPFQVLRAQYDLPLLEGRGGRKNRTITSISPLLPSCLPALLRDTAEHFFGRPSTRSRSSRLLAPSLFPFLSFFPSLFPEP